MRINKYIASSGFCSRRKADEYIIKGQVKVNGAVLTEPGYDVSENDTVLVCGKPVTGKEDFVYYALNKPCGYITSVKDEKDRLTVMDLMTDVTARVFPVGRLDYDSAGLIIMTNDGELSQHIAHPKNKIYKTYLCEVQGELTLKKAELLRTGVVIEDKKTAPAFVEIKKQKGDMSLVEIKICEGRNRQVRKMFKAVGCTVTYLQRTQIGEIKLGRLHEGDYRRLTASEVNYLKNS